MASLLATTREMPALDKKGRHVVGSGKTYLC